MLGIFHVIMMYLGIMGKKCSKAGIRELSVQSDILAIESVNKVLSGKMYNRVVHVHKALHEGPDRFLLNKMEDNDVDNFELSLISDMQEKLNDFYENITQVSHEDFIESDFLTIQ